MSKASTAACDVWSLIAKDYKVGDVLNTGRDGTLVRKAVHKPSGQYVALKSIPLTSRSRRDIIRREAQLMQCLDHPNVLQCYEIFEGPYEAVLVLEFCAGGDLLDYVNGCGPSTEADARKMFVQVLQALIESHAFGIAHRDIKLENVLLRDDGSLVLGDYGLAKTYSPGEQFTLPCGTLTYAAPELHESVGQMRVDPQAADVFALGVLLYALVTARLPFQGNTDAEVVANIRNGKYELPSRLSPQLRELIQAMLATDQKQRPSLSAVLDHVWTTPDRGSASPPKPTRTQSLQAIRVTSKPLGTNSAVSLSKVNTETDLSPRKQRHFLLDFCKSVASTFEPKKLQSLLIN